MSIDPSLFTSQSQSYISKSFDLASDNHNIEVHPLHLALAVFSDPSGLGPALASKCEVEVKEVELSLRSALKKLSKQDPPPSNISPNQSYVRVLKSATGLSFAQKDSHTAVDHIVLSLFEDAMTASAFSSCGLLKGKVEKAVKQVRGASKANSAQAEKTYASLEKYTIDLVKRALDGKLDPVIGRDTEIRRVIQILSRRTKNNPVLCGSPGVGKTAIVEGLAMRIVRGDVPSSLPHRVLSLDLGSLISGASHRGEFEERLKSVLNEIEESEERNDPIILFIDEIHQMIGAGRADSAMDAANLLKPKLARGELRCIGATTVEEYRKYIEKDPAFERRFARVDVEEPSVPDCVSILRGLKDRYQTHFGVRILDSALVLAAQLSHRYITNRFLPDKAIDLIDEACSALRVQLDSQPEVIDKLERRELQLDVEATALQTENDEPSKQRLKVVKEELSRVREQLRPLKLRHEKEKERVEAIRQAKRKVESLQIKMANAERARDTALVADLRYGAIPDLEKRIGAMTHEMEIENAKDENRLLTETVGPKDIADIVAKWTGIPVNKLSQSDRERLLALGQRLHEKVVGQDVAVDAVSSAILRSRAGLSRPTQPTGSFLFLGGSGVGKTQMAKALASELFDDEKAIIRIDMSEYSEPHAVSRLIGAPPGYVGYDQGGQLTEAVRRKPYSVILFDEVEKAHPQIFNTLLQILDDGRCTDGRGVTVDFTNTVIIMTSNLGSQALVDGTDQKTGKVSETAQESVMKAVRGFFRPEFINRLDEIVMFHPLTTPQLNKIVDLQISSLQDRLKDQDIILNCTEAAKRAILSASGSNTAFGARPLKRYIEKNITTDMSKLLIAGKLLPKSRVKIDADASGKLTFTSTPATENQIPTNPNGNTKWPSKDGFGGAAKRTFGDLEDNGTRDMDL